MSTDIRERFPKGTYLARAVGANAVRFGADKNGNERIGVLLQLLNEGYENERVTWYGSFAGKAPEITMRMLRDMGWRCDNITVLEGLGETEVEIQIDHELYESKWRVTVSNVRPAGGGGVVMKNELDAAGIAAFAAKMRGLALKTMPKGTKCAAPAFSPPPVRPEAYRREPVPPSDFTNPEGVERQPGEDDDIPY